MHQLIVAFHPSETILQRDYMFVVDNWPILRTGRSTLCNEMLFKDVLNLWPGFTALGFGELPDPYLTDPVGDTAHREQWFARLNRDPKIRAI